MSKSVPRCLGFDDDTMDDNNICIACDGNSSHDPLCQRSYKCNILAITRQLLQVIDEDNTERLLINDDNSYSDTLHIRRAMKGSEKSNKVVSKNKLMIYHYYK